MYSQPLPIILVDDDTFSRRVAREVLARVVYADIAEASDLQSAIRQLEHAACSVLITDIHMPGGGGLELLQQIRCGKTAAPRHLRVIALTSFSTTHVLAIALALDVNGFIVKPLNPKLTEAKLNQVLSTETQLRPALAYQKLDTRVDHLLVPPTGEHPPNAPRDGGAASANATPMQGRQLSVSALRAGMRLAKPICALNGQLLLNAGHLLSNTTIHHLIDLQEVYDCGSVWVDSEGQPAQA